MTMTEQLALAGEKVEHWRGKCERAASMLSKWESRLKGLQSKAKPVPTATKLPPVMLVPDMPQETGSTNGKVVPMSKGKTKKPPKKN
jgi:hypothetical protein